MWRTLGKWIGKGILWIAKHPEAVEVVIGGIKAAKGKPKPAPAPEDKDAA